MCITIKFDILINLTENFLTGFKLSSHLPNYWFLFHFLVSV